MNRYPRHGGRWTVALRAVGFRRRPAARRLVPAATRGHHRGEPRQPSDRARPDRRLRTGMRRPGRERRATVHRHRIPPGARPELPDHHAARDRTREGNQRRRRHLV